MSIDRKSERNLARCTRSGAHCNEGITENCLCKSKCLCWTHKMKTDFVRNKKPIRTFSSLPLVLSALIIWRDCAIVFVIHLLWVPLRRWWWIDSPILDYRFVFALILRMCAITDIFQLHNFWSRNTCTGASHPNSAWLHFGCAIA